MASPDTIKIEVRRLSFAYGDNAVLNNLDIDVPEAAVTAVVGPSGRGKSTLLTVFNRLWEDIPGACMDGQVHIRLGGTLQDIYHPSIPLADLRRRVGMVFQTPNPLPMSIYKNVAFPLKMAGGIRRSEMRAIVERSLRRAFLWEEVKDRLGEDARALSGGQQQRLCIARALAVEPEVLLLDEPTSSLDEAATGIIEELILSLKAACTIVMVSHDTAQVRRVADHWIELSEQPG